MLHARAVRRMQGTGEKAKMMLDALYVVLTIAFFVLGILYVRGCERLK